MKRRIVIIADSYFPYATMSGNIAKRVADELKKSFDVNVIAYKYGDKDMEVIEGISVYYVNNWSWKAEKWFTDKLKRKNTKPLRYAYFLKKVVSNVLRNISDVGVDYGVVNGIVKQLETLNFDERIEIVLSIAAPFECQIANYKYKIKNKEIKSVLFQVDYWVNLKDVGLPKILRNLRKTNREHMLTEMSIHCDLVMTPVVKKAEGPSEKIKSCQLPLLKKNDINSKDNSINPVITLVYAGSLNKRERNPKKFIELLLRINCKIEFHIYHRGDCNELINSYATHYPELIFDHGTVSSEEAYKAIGKANILIMFGTPEGEQIAGKTFDYISTGKKIIYIYQEKTDINIEFLKEYPLLLSIDNNADIDDTKLVDNVRKFIFDSKIKNIGYEEIEKMYSDALPECFCGQFIL